MPITNLTIIDPVSSLLGEKSHKTVVSLRVGGWNRSGKQQSLV